MRHSGYRKQAHADTHRKPHHVAIAVDIGLFIKRACGHIASCERITGNPNLALRSPHLGKGELVYLRNSNLAEDTSGSGHIIPAV